MVCFPPSWDITQQSTGAAAGPACTFGRNGIGPPTTTQLAKTGQWPFSWPWPLHWYTILLRALMAATPVLVPSFASLSISFVIARGFAKLPTPDPVLGFRAISLRSLMLWLGLRSFVVIAPSLDVVLRMPQTTRSAAHLSMSC